MSGICSVIKVKAPINEDNDLGYVVINESDFDKDTHELFGEEKDDKKMSVAELKEALAEKGIDIPDGAKKADLQALLNA